MSQSAAYLLDVNVLLAFGVRQHPLHRRVSVWAQAGQLSFLMTCSITELGFVRVASKVYGTNVEQASALLSFIRAETRFATEFILDDQDATHLPVWVKASHQTTDGHLLQLAQAHGAVLATLDARIPSAFLIPSELDEKGLTGLSKPTAGAKALLISLALSARLKSCPVTKRQVCGFFNKLLSKFSCQLDGVPIRDREGCRA